MRHSAVRVSVGGVMLWQTIIEWRPVMFGDGLPTAVSMINY